MLGANALQTGSSSTTTPAGSIASAVHHYLSEESYWAAGRPREVMDELIETAARVVGLYAPDGSQVGFARVVSDGHTVSYLADVYVLEEARGRGFGVELVRFAVDEEPVASTKFILHTRDMHRLYAEARLRSAGCAPDGALAGLADRAGRWPGTSHSPAAL